MNAFYEIAEMALALEAKGKKIVRLNVGDTNLPVPSCAISAAIKAMKKAKGSYGSSAGMPQLREAIARREECGAENVVVGPGSKHLLFALLSVLGKKGAKVAIPSPHYPAYLLACSQLELSAKLIPTTLQQGWQLPGELPGADIAILCNPLNPTSTTYSDSSIRKAISTGAHIIIDEAYKGIAFRSIPRYDGAIRVRSFSKEFNMEDWRLAYAIVPEEIAQKLIAFNQATSTCVPSFVQMAGLACLENEKELLGANVLLWKKRMQTAGKAMRAQGFQFASPAAGMYLFATHRGIQDSLAYARALIRKGIAVAPGESFGSGYSRFIRICANQNEGTLEAAIERMGEAALA